jgi:hypothetical protein
LEHDVGKKPEEADGRDDSPKRLRTEPIAEHLPEGHIALRATDEPLLIAQYVPEHREEHPVHQSHDEDPLRAGAVGDVRAAEEGKRRQERCEGGEQENDGPERAAGEVVVLGGIGGEPVGDQPDAERHEQVTADDSELEGGVHHQASPPPDARPSDPVSTPGSGPSASMPIPHARRVKT